MGQKIKENIGLKPELRDQLVMPKQVNSVAVDVAALTVDFNLLQRNLGMLDY